MNISLKTLKYLHLSEHFEGKIKYKAYDNELQGILRN